MKKKAKKPSAKRMPAQNKKARKPKKPSKPLTPSEALAGALALHDEVTKVKKDLKKANQDIDNLQERVQDIEIHVNLLTRLLTTLCIEKFGMRVGVLKRLIKRIEKEAIRDSQILHLESLYNMPSMPKKKGDAEKPSAQDDPWDDIA